MMVHVSRLYIRGCLGKTSKGKGKVLSSNCRVRPSLVSDSPSATDQVIVQVKGHVWGQEKVESSRDLEETPTICLRLTTMRKSQDEAGCLFLPYRK